MSKKQSTKTSSRRSRRLTREEQEEAYNAMSRPEPRYEFKCKTLNQKLLVKSIRENVITVAAGVPGSGKTFVSSAEALRLLQTDPTIKRILFVKSVTQLDGEEVGFVKGDLTEKMAPVIESYMDNFRKLIGDQATSMLMQSGSIEVLPLAFARGRTFDNTIILTDESQNISKKNLKTILTRIGENSKIIIIGDTKQIDLRDESKSSLAWFMSKCAGRDNFGVVTFGPEDQVRNPIINVIESMFDEE